MAVHYSNQIISKLRINNKEIYQLHFKMDQILESLILMIMIGLMKYTKGWYPIITMMIYVMYSSSQARIIMQPKIMLIRIKLLKTAG